MSELVSKPSGIDDEMVPEDDRIIGRAFRGSLVVIAALAALGAAGFYIAKRPREAAPVTAIQASAPQEVVQVEAPPLPFVDITKEAGIDFVHFNGARGDKLLPETMGGGVAFFDYDGDGDSDLLFVNSSSWPHDPPASPRPTSALYRNDGKGKFQNVSRETGLDVTMYGMGVAVADYDGDGDVDVFLTAVGPNKLLRNEGGRFKDVTAEAGVAGDAKEWSSGAGFFDYDNDGDLDLFVCNYVRWSKEIDFELDFRLTGVGRAFGPPQNYQGTYPYLYRNDGGGKFTEVGKEAGLHVDNPATGVPMAKALAIGPVDVDGDGFIDVLMANDTVQKFLFHNQGDGTFVEAGEAFGIAYDRNGNATGAMGIDSAYYRNDHNLGFFIGNFANEMSSVYVAQDDPQFFVDESITEGIGAPSRLMLSFGVFLFDADLDGRLDLLQANGHIEDEIQKVDPSQHYRQPGQLFWNAGDAGFVLEPDDKVGDLTREMVGRGAAYADIDGDGDLDTVLTQIAGPPLLLRNDQAQGNHWVRIKLVGKAPNRDAIGAWIELVAGGVTQRRQVMPTRSYVSQVEPIVTFGLGKTQRIDAVKVKWPDGREQAVEGVEVDRVRVVEEG
ncbi:MAG: CRTAC1 family protein [Thermoanaerobaculia bacterium]|nr:CRTAC1 family protein [Thermoanaerobaculia bacterium]